MKSMNKPLILVALSALIAFVVIKSDLLVASKTTSVDDESNHYSVDGANVSNESKVILKTEGARTEAQEIKPLLDNESIPELTEADADPNAYDTKSVVNAFLNENYRSEWGVATQEQLESAFSDDKFISDLAEKNMFFNYADCKETICKIAFTYTRNKDSDPVINEAIAMDRNQFLTLKMFSKTKLQNFNSDINFNNGTFEFYLNKPKSQ